MLLVIVKGLEGTMQGFIHKIGSALIQRRRRNKLKSKVMFDGNAVLDCDSHFEGKNRIGGNTTLLNTTLGFASYISNDCFIKNTVVGRYCSIGENVITVSGTHPIQFVSTHPVFYSTRKQVGFSFAKEEMFKEFSFLNSEKSIAVEIGNDVWIGSYARIMEGIRVGDGAIIAAGAYVTKDVPPYAIVGGIPAGVIRYRFDEDKIQKLLDICWWEKDYQWIESNAELFIDIDQFIVKCKQ